MKKIHLGSLFIAVAFCVGILSPGSAFSKNWNPGIIPPNAVYGGMTYGQWSANLYYAAVTGEDVAGPKNVYILPGKGYWDPRTSFDLEVPAGESIGLMVFGFPSTTNGPVIPELGYETENWVQADLEWLEGFAADSNNLFVEVDGRPVKNLEAHVVSGSFPNTLDMDLGFGLMSLDSVVSCSLLLAPLTPGQHTIDLRWFGQPFLIYNITVVPGLPAKSGKAGK
jgi:hypothetical protein